MLRFRKQDLPLQDGEKKISISIGTKHFPGFCVLCIVCLHKACHASYLKITHVENLESFKL